MNEGQHTVLAVRLGALRRGRRAQTLIATAFALVLGTLPPRVSAQPSSEGPDAIHGTVVNAVTHEPIPRALVVSFDNRFATMTDSQGRFEFTFPRAEPPKATPPGSSEGTSGEVMEGNAEDVSQLNTVVIQPSESNRPNGLSARKPSFLEDDNTEPHLALALNAKELTLSLVPEAILAGQVSLPTSEAPDSIQLQLYRLQIQDGRAHWIPAGNAASRSTGEFRFAELHAGTYKLLTRELLDRDPLTFDPRGQLFGYPPVYYQDAAGFDSATTIELSAGQTAEAHISLVKQPYYRVKIAVENMPPGFGTNVSVYSQGRSGPGYALGYNQSTQSIEGMLPNGTYTVEANCIGQLGQAALSGMMTLNIKGAAVDGARLTLVPAGSVAINVKEEFGDKDPGGSTNFSDGKRSFVLRGPRRYLNVSLESADDFVFARSGMLRSPKGPDDEALAIDNVQPGRYWVRVQSSRGYVASVRAGTTDLLHEPLTVGAGGADTPIEITMRDDTATIDGKVEGVVPPPSSEAVLPPGPEESATVSLKSPPAHVYFIPLPDSGGEAAQISTAPDGTFSSQPLAPGEYRLLAFDREQRQLEYRNPQAMKSYGNMGPVVHVAGGQKEHVTLQLILASE